MNGKVIDDIQAWLEKHPASQTDPGCYLFMSQRGAVLNVPSVIGKVDMTVSLTQAVNLFGEQTA